MAAVLTLSIFIVLFAVGLAVLLLLKRDLLSIGETLVAPAFGLSTFVVPTIILSQVGLPVGHFALVEIIALGLPALGVLFWRRDSVPWKALLFFVPLVVIAFILVAWPQLIFGFNWVSFSNDDMINYSLAADRLVAHSFYHLPQMRPDEIFRGYDASYWFLYVVNGERTGVEMLLAVVASATHLRGFQAFMPTILAFDLSLLCTATALGWAFRKNIGDAYIAGALVAVSPLTALGSFYQLFAQVGGLPILTAQTALLAFTAPRIPAASGDRLRLGVTLGILIAGQALIYPELLPFAGLMYGAWLFLIIIRKANKLRDAILPVTAAVLTFILAAPWYGPRMISLIASRVLSQMPHGGGLAPTEFVFPYFLIPSGMSSLWGFTTLTVFRGIWLSIGIGVGLVLTLATGLYTVYLAVRRSHPTGIMLSIMFALGLAMFIKKVDFGLFKLGMYIQPFLLTTFTAALITQSRRRFLVTGVIGLLLISGAFNQWSYAETTFNGPHGASSGYVEVRDATTQHLLETLNGFERASNKPDAYLSDTDNLVLAKYETGYIGQRPLFMLAYNFRENLNGISKPAIPFLRPYYRERDEYARNLLRPASQFSSAETFPFGRSAVASFDLPRISGRYKTQMLLHTGGADTVLNRSDRRYDDGIVYLVKPRAIQNDLTFVQSSLGFAPGPGSPMSKISLFQVEPDYFRTHNTMSGISRYLVFLVLNPTPNARMLLNITDTLSSDGKYNLPPASVIGKHRELFPLVGAGSARVVSPPISPERIGGYDILGLDMGENGHHFIVRRTGLMNLYGTNIQIDPRLLTAFARNISVISASQYHDMKAPQYIPDLGAGLRNHNLIYSGIYEDGWVSKSAYVKLATRHNNESLIINGLVPLIKNPQFSEKLICKIDGLIARTIDLRVGYFHIAIPMRFATGNHIVTFSFTSFERLPGGDGRPISAKFTSLGFRHVKRPT